MKVTRAQVLRVASLACLSLSEEEVELYRAQLAAILEHAEILQRLDSESIPPTATVSMARNVMRPDIPAPSLTQSEALHNAPSVQGSHFAVKAVLEDG